MNKRTPRAGGAAHRCTTTLAQAADPPKPPLRGQTQSVFSTIWGVDYLKYDLCQGQRSSFAVMRDALKASCSLKLTSAADMWRIGFDINASWGSVTTPPAGEKVLMIANAVVTG